MHKNPQNTVGERLSEVLAYLKNSRKISKEGDISVKAGHKSPSSITEMKKDRQDVSEEVLNILKSDYQVSPDYIIHGEGEMFLLDTKKPPQPGGGGGYTDEYIQLLKQQLQELRAEREEVQRLKEQLKALETQQSEPPTTEKGIRSHLLRIEKNQVMMLAAVRAFQEFWATHSPPKRMEPQDVIDEIDNKAIELAETWISEGIPFPEGR